MERLFTSITNAGATATQNKNIMQTGYYAGEREDFMRENLFMTETTMAPVKIALDHGWSSIKGEHTFMETSIVPVDYEPLTKNGLLEYKGKKYIVGQGRLGKQATKTENENCFLLTLAGIAKELVELYAIRQNRQGYKFGPDTVWQQEFEEMFPYQETDDQLTAIAETKQDMESTTFKTDFCGELQFNIHTWGNNKSMYQDTAHTRLEEKIISIVARLELHAEAIKETRIWAEQQRIKREEEERRRQIYQAKKEKELAKFQSLFTMADRHFKANIIRQYVCSYEEQLKTRSITDEEILAELAWAKDKADWLDPLISKPDEYLDHYNKDAITQPKNSYSSSYNPPSQHSEYNPWAKPWWRK